MERPAQPSTTASGAEPAAAAPAEPATPRRGAPRLFRKYFVLILALVTGALLIPSSISLYFSYRETLDALHGVQREKALAAAGRIEQYIENVQGQLRGAALAQLGTDGTEQRRIEFLKLLKQVPLITDIAYVGGDGCEKARVSRLSMDASGDCLRDRSGDPAFVEPTPTRPWYGPVTFHKETEPYMQIAVRSGGDKGPVTVADVNLKFMWDVITRIRIGEKGKAYVVDSTGYLIADPDIGLVLRKTDLSGLAHVKAALGGGDDDVVVVTRDAAGDEVLSAHARIDPLGWTVFVEQPASEVLARLNASIVRIGLLLLAGLAISALVAMGLARRMARPISTLQEGAQLIGEGKLDHAIDVQTGDELETLADQFNRMTSQLRESYAGLERKVDERTAALTTSLEQQTAISEILRVISSSPTDVQPVLQEVAQRAARLCEAEFARILLIDGDRMHPVVAYAASGASPPPATDIPLKRTSISGRAAIERRTIHHVDVVPLLEAEYPDAVDNSIRMGYRAVLAVPLMRDAGAYGAIFLYRNVPRGFSPGQIALVETFARQAAIAIDNVRLFNQTKEALDQQTAISEILRVISASPTDVQPVMDAVAKHAALLCDAPSAHVMLRDGDKLNVMSSHSRGEITAIPAGYEVALDRTMITGRAVLDGVTVHHADIVPLLDDDFGAARENALRFGFRAVLAVPLMRESTAYGTLFVWRPVPGYFAPDQVALLETFARQAAIAIDNVRLFNRTKESLDQQTAMSEILRVTSSSPTDVHPVLQAVAERALVLCGAGQATIVLVDGDELRCAAAFGSTRTLGIGETMPLDRGSIAGRAVIDRTALQVEDLAAVSEEEFPVGRALQRRVGHHTALAVPLMREERAIGAIQLWRMETRAFSAQKVELVKTFADQAAIAIDNVRLFNQTKEALEQQTAISEILRVISSSPTDVQPVLQAVAERAAVLCEAPFAQVMLVDGDQLRNAATHSRGDATAGGYESPLHMGLQFPLKPTYITGRTALECRTIHYADVTNVLAREFPDAADNQRRFGFRAVLAVPLTREKGCYGVLYVWRREARAFTPEQVTLLETFARQAAIAIDNVRLFNQTKEALDQQRASAEVLSAISSSIADVKPVFDVILASCQRLFDGHNVGVIIVRPDGMLDIGAYKGEGQAELSAAVFPMPLDRKSGGGTAILERRVIEIQDTDAPGVPERTRQGAHAIGVGSIVFAPMLSEGRALGALWVGRPTKAAFGEKSMALLRTFAEQAVIAINNTRLFNETRDALEQQRASGEVLSAISSSIADVKPVFDVILGNCQRLIGARNVGMTLLHDDGMLHIDAHVGPGFEELKGLFPRPIGRDVAGGISILDRSVLVYPDLDAPDVPAVLQAGRRSLGDKSFLCAPMLLGERAIGALWIGREHKGAFADKEIALLKTFAGQAVIALQNSRLFNETREALEQQKASGEVLSAISSSIADTAPVFERIVTSCEHLFAGKIVGINLLGDDDRFELGAYHGTGRQELLAGFPLPLDEASGSGMAILRRGVVHFPDVAAPDVPPATRHLCDVTGQRAVVFAPMLWEGRGLGVIFVGRPTPGPFSPKEIALLKTFADQASIAIQNARLFREIQQKSRELEIASQHKSEFLANMSHELRTPLNAIIGFSEVLLERMFGELNVKQDDYLKDIHSSGVHLLSLINDILDLSKVEAGRMELEPSRFDAPTAIQNAMTLVRERAQRHGIALSADLAPEVTEVTADERKFKQILLNLLTNAVKFTPDGGRVDVIARRAGDALEVAVRDTGIGIAKADHAAVFEEFRQVGRHYTNKQEGTGLGLALTKRFVELHGGTIRLDSEPGKGSTFTFTIPERARATAPGAEEAIP